MPLLKYIKNNLLSVVIALVFFLEGYSKALYFNTGINSILPKTIKSLLICYMILKLISHKKVLKEFYYVLLLTVFFIIGQLSTEEGIVYSNIVLFSKYVFAIVCYMYFKCIPVKNKVRVFYVFEGVILVNSVLIFIGYFFDVIHFKTYLGARFGYNGLFYSSSLSSYVYLIALFYFLIVEKAHFFYNRKVVFVIFSSCLIGTKTIYLSLVFICLLYFTKYAKFKYKNIFAAALVAISIFLGYLVFFKWGIFNEIRRSEGFFSSLLSFRNDLFLDETLPYVKNNWTFINYCFGGVNDFTTRSEMGFIDVLYFFGFVGGALYIILYCKTFITFKINTVNMLFLCFLGCVVFVTGNYFIYTTTPLFLLVLREKITDLSISKLRE
ncbi:hypothetical protein [Winogradskyella poriferorum]|jgi:hypothetical protein|uniref:hypothetical protein n=1 Tax=Winogradskyella poriferorum TaxID=307627 RepID=UPI003D65383C